MTSPRQPASTAGNEPRLCGRRLSLNSRKIPEAAKKAEGVSGRTALAQASTKRVGIGRQPCAHRTALIVRYRQRLSLHDPRVALGRGSGEQALQPGNAVCYRSIRTLLMHTISGGNVQQSQTLPAAKTPGRGFAREWTMFLPAI